MGSHGNCVHDHDCGEAECGVSYSLYEHVDLARVTCLNELLVDSEVPWSCPSSVVFLDTYLHS